MTHVRPFTIAGKYFIQHEVVEPRSGMTKILHGQILGPVLDESSPIYLVEIWPWSSTTHVALKTQYMIPIHDLCNCPLFDDKAVWLAEWQQIVDTVEGQQRARKAQQPPGVSSAQAMAEVVRGASGPTIGDLLSSLFDAQTEPPPAAPTARPRRRRRTVDPSDGEPMP